MRPYGVTCMHKARTWSLYPSNMRRDQPWKRCRIFRGALGWYFRGMNRNRVIQRGDRKRARAAARREIMMALEE